MSPIVCVLSMLLAVTLIPARAGVYAHAELTDLDIELTDLDPNDGVAPSFTLDGDVRASAGWASYPSDTYGGDSYEGTDWMAPTHLSSVNSIGTAFAEMLPGSYSAHASVNAPIGNGGDNAYTVQASVSKNSMGGLILSPHSRLTFSGAIAASIVYESTEWYDVTASASFGILAPASSFYQVAYYEEYKYSDWIFMPRGGDGPFSITLENTSDSELVAQVWTSVYARATRAVTASPIPEPHPYILLLCGMGLLGAILFHPSAPVARRQVGKVDFPEGVYRQWRPWQSPLCIYRRVNPRRVSHFSHFGVPRVSRQRAPGASSGARHP